jgi:hypothetical protein
MNPHTKFSQSLFKRTNVNPQFLLRSLRHATRRNRERRSDHTRQLGKKQLDEGIDNTFVLDQSNRGLAEIIGVRPEFEVLSLAADSSADFALSARHRSPRAPNAASSPLRLPWGDNRDAIFKDAAANFADNAGQISTTVGTGRQIQLAGRCIFLRGRGRTSSRTWTEDMRLGLIQAATDLPVPSQPSGLPVRHFHARVHHLTDERLVR